MLIRCTRTRVYDDLVGDHTPASIRAIEPVVRPGMRVLVCPGGTGALGARIARLVGPSGAVVSLDHDDESVQFATRRYPLANVAYEKGTSKDIGGETNGAFDAAIVAFADETEEAATNALAEALRIVKGGGWVLVRAEGRVIDESGRGVAADNRALLRHAIAAAGEDAGAPASARIDAVRWLEEPTGTPAVLISLRSDQYLPQDDQDELEQD
jgi:ubiquinone/menaquinone biosynthesis C-methylase UbiE